MLRKVGPSLISFLPTRLGPGGGAEGVMEDRGGAPHWDPSGHLLSSRLVHPKPSILIWNTSGTLIGAWNCKNTGRHLPNSEGGPCTLLETTIKAFSLSSRLLFTRVFALIASVLAIARWIRVFLFWSLEENKVTPVNWWWNLSLNLKGHYAAGLLWGCRLVFSLSSILMEDLYFGGFSVNAILHIVIYVLFTFISACTIIF